jgi:hypothetical protein
MRHRGALTSALGLSLLDGGGMPLQVRHYGIHRRLNRSISHYNQLHTNARVLTGSVSHPIPKASPTFGTALPPAMRYQLPTVNCNPSA